MDTTLIILIVVCAVLFVGLLITGIILVHPKRRKNTLHRMINDEVEVMKSVMDNSKDTLKSLSTDMAETKAEGIEITTRAIKNGFTKDDSIFCKYCGEKIDKDSKFCNKCGKEL